MQTILAIAGGGALGALMRHYLNSAVMHLTGGGFPWGIFTANILGSFFMGLLIGIFAHVWNPPQALRAFLTIGMLGAFTTFSTFSLDIVTLAERGQVVAAGLYTAGSVILAVVALSLGMFIIRAFAA